MKQYLDLANRIINDGKWIHNARTGKNCLTVINADFEYNVAENKFPLITTRKSYWKKAIAELLGYIRGESDAGKFRELGTDTWDANANQNQDWLCNPHRGGEDSMGLVYGAVGNAWPIHNPYDARKKIDLLKKVYDNLRNGIDDRGETWTFWNPGVFHLGCLRPCMHTHTFSLVDDTLYLTSFQRSVDVPLGLNFNQIQAFTLLALMAQITGHKPGVAYHKMINCHIYENQVDLMRDVQLKREPLDLPRLKINPDIKTLEDLRTWVSTDDFLVEGYEHHEPIKYPFSV